MTTIAVITEDPAFLSKAQQLAQQLQIDLTENYLSDHLAYLIVSTKGLKLQLANSPMKAIDVDFCSGVLAHRCRYGGGKSQLIAKAIGLKNKKNLSVWDLTAGLGRDAYVLAHLGCSVTLIERSPIIAALLQDGLERATLAANPTVQQLRLVHQDAFQFLQNAKSTSKPDVIYLDPMFTELANSALVKKEMRILRHCIGDDSDASQLLEQALQFGCKRIVVKRARLAPTLNERKPTYHLIGKSTRFDIYVTGHEAET